MTPLMRIMPTAESEEAAAARERPDLACYGLDTVTDTLPGSAMITLRGLVEVCESIKLVTLFAQLVGQRAGGLWCGHSHLRKLDMLTTSSATHRGEVMAGAQGPEPQIVCPESRLSGEAQCGRCC